MPNINTKFTLSGEKEYKAALSEISSGMKVLDSEMRKASSAYADNADSVEALNAKNDVLERKISTQEEKIETLKKALQESAEKYGEADKKTMSWQAALNNAEAELNKMNSELEGNNEKIEKSGETMVNLGDVAGGLAEKFGVTLPSKIKTTMNGMGSLNIKAVAVVSGFAAVVSAIVKVEQALASMTAEAAEAAKELEKLSSTTGMSTETLQEFEYASEMIGVSTDQIADALKETTNKMQEAQNGSEEVTAAYEKLGVAITDSSGNLRSAEDVFYDTIDALGDMTNTTERDAVAMDLLSETAQQLNPLIEIGSEGLAAYAEEAQEMGYVLSEDAVGALTEVSDAQNKLLKSQEATTKQISAEFAPYMTEALTKCQELIEKVGKALIDSGAVEAFGSILDSTVSLLEPLGSLVTSILPALAEILNPIAKLCALIADTADALVAIFTLDFTKFNTALGLNAKYGMLSNQQKLYYGDATSTNTYVEGVGWVGNGYTSGNASGTDNWIGGFTTVSENGPEEIYLPSGSRIQTASETRYGSGGVTIQNVTIDAKNIKELNDLVRIFGNERIMSRMGVRA